MCKTISCVIERIARVLANKRDLREMNKRAQAYSDNFSATTSASDAAFDHDSKHLAAKNRSRSAPLNEIEIRARLDAFAKELAQAERDRAKH